MEGDGTRGLDSWLGHRDTQKNAWDNWGRNRLRKRELLEKARNQHVQLPACKGFCGEQHPLLAEGGTAPVPNRMMGGNFQPKPRIRGQRGGTGTIILSHFQVKTQGPRLESMQDPGSSPAAPQPSRAPAHSAQHHHNPPAPEPHVQCSLMLSTVTSSGCPPRASAQGTPHGGTPNRVHKTAPTARTAFPTPTPRTRRGCLSTSATRGRRREGSLRERRGTE